MSVKILGAGLLIICGGALGFSRLSAQRRQISLLEDLDSSLAVMEGEIALCSRALPEIFETLARESSRECAELFGELVKSCERMSAGVAWRECLEKMELPPEALRALVSVGAVLGAYDGERQRAEIAHVRERLGAIRDSIKAELAAKGKSYPTLGACFAGIVAMLMI